jgi:hypothetical protein
MARANRGQLVKTVHAKLCVLASYGPKLAYWLLLAGVDRLIDVHLVGPARSQHDLSLRSGVGCLATAPNLNLVGSSWDLHCLGLACSQLCYRFAVKQYCISRPGSPHRGPPSYAESAHALGRIDGPYRSLVGLRGTARGHTGCRDDRGNYDESRSSKHTPLSCFSSPP